MDTQFIVGNSYTKKEIEEHGFRNTKVTSLVMFYRKDKILLAFYIPKPLQPKLYKLISINSD